MKSYTDIKQGARIVVTGTRCCKQYRPELQNKCGKVVAKDVWGDDRIVLIDFERVILGITHSGDGRLIRDTGLWFLLDEIKLERPIQLTNK